MCIFLKKMLEIYVSLLGNKLKLYHRKCEMVAFGRAFLL